MIRSTQAATSADAAPRSTLPTDVIRAVFEHVRHPRDVVSFSRSSRTFHAIAGKHITPANEANAREVYSSWNRFAETLASGPKLDVSWRLFYTKSQAAALPSSAIREAGRLLASRKLNELQRRNALQLAVNIIPHLTPDEIERIGRRLVSSFGLPRMKASPDEALQESISVLSPVMAQMKPTTQRAVLRQGRQSATEWRPWFTSNYDWCVGGNSRNDKRTYHLHRGFAACFDVLDAKQRDIAVHQLDDVGFRDYRDLGAPLLKHWHGLTREQAVHVLKKSMSEIHDSEFPSRIAANIVEGLRRIIGTGENLSALKQVRDELLTSSRTIEAGCLLGALLMRDDEHGWQPILDAIDQEFGQLHDDWRHDKNLSVLSYSPCLPISIQERIVRNAYLSHCIPNISHFDERNVDALMMSAWPGTSAHSRSYFATNTLRDCMPILPLLSLGHQMRWLQEFRRSAPFLLGMLSDQHNRSFYIENIHECLNSVRKAASNWRELAQPICIGVLDTIMSHFDDAEWCLPRSAAVSALLPLLDGQNDTWRRAVSFLVEAGRIGWEQSDPFALRLIIRQNTIGLPTTERLRILAAWERGGPWNV